MGDVDGDNFLEVILVGAGAPVLLVNKGVGATGWDGFESGVVLAGASGDLLNALSAELRDVDGDGRLDLVVGTTGAVLLLRGAGCTDAAWTCFETARTVATGTGRIALANVDGDTDVDLLVGTATGVKPWTQAPISTTIIGLDDVTVAFGDPANPEFELVEGRGAFVLLTGGVAGTFSAKLAGGSGGVTVDASASVRFNSSTSAVDETIVVGGNPIRVLFTAPGEVASVTTGAYYDVTATATLVVAGVVEITGTMNFSSTGTYEFSGVTIWIGDGPAYLEDGTTINPDARGLLITDVEGLVTGTTPRAFTGSGQFRLLGVEGVVFEGAVDIAVDEGAMTIVITGSLTLRVSGLVLTGDFGIERASDGTVTVTLGSASGTTAGNAVVLALGNPSAAGADDEPLRVEIAAGTITIGAGGIVASVDATVDVNIPGIDPINVPALLRLNTTNADALPAGGGALVKAGTVRVVLGTPTALVGLSIAGQTLKGVWAFEQVTLPVGANAPPGTLPTKVIRAAVSHLKLRLGAPMDDSQALTAGIEITGGEGALVMTPSGIAARFSSPSITVAIPGGMTLEGSFSLALNTTTAAVSEQVDLGGTTVSLVLPAGPYLRFEGTGVVLSLGAQKITADVVLERATVGTATVTRDRLPQRHRRLRRRHHHPGRPHQRPRHVRPLRRRPRGHGARHGLAHDPGRLALRLLRAPGQLQHHHRRPLDDHLRPPGGHRHGPGQRRRQR